jgi:hypothetical protein
VVAVVVTTSLVAACGRPVGRVAPAPPAPLVVRTGCGSFEIAADGAVARHKTNWAPPWAPHAVSHPAFGVWVAHPGGLLAVYRGGRLLWRSRVRHGSDEVAVRGSSIAFSVYRRTADGRPELWMARVGRREFLAGRAEEPIGWTAGGLVTLHGTALRVRGPDGTVYRTVGHGHGALSEPGGTVLYVTARGDVIRTNGLRNRRLAGGFGRRAWVQRLDGGVLDVTTQRRAVFLRRDGSPLGISAPVDEPAATMGSVIALPHGAGVVYAVHVRLHGSRSGVNVVYVARPHRPARRVFTRRVPRLSCGEYAGVSYLGGRILYVDDEGPIAVLDPSGRKAPVDLTSALRVLQPQRRALWQLDADWASKWR